MKAAVVTHWGELKVMDVPEPKIGPYEAVVKTRACSLCNGTDVKIIAGHLPWVSEADLPGILGHESVGEVVEVGAKVKNLKVGDRVFRPGGPVEGFGSCWGGFAEYGRVADVKALAEDPDAPAVPHGSAPMLDIIPDTVSDEDAAIAITMKETLSWLGKSRFPFGCTVAVTGVGPVGLTFLSQCKLLGARQVISLARRDEAGDRAMQFGADAYVNVTKGDPVAEVKKLTGGAGVNRAIEAVGSIDALCMLKDMLAPDGRLGIYGSIDPAAEFDAGRLRNLFIYPPFDVGVQLIQPDESSAHAQVMGMIERGELRPKQFITHRLAIEGIHEGIELVKSREAIKVVIQL